ncbi:MAG: sulfotransferase [Myxococcota bacterium]
MLPSLSMLDPSMMWTSQPKNAWLENPVLFYGCRKSGTTLLMSLLDGALFGGEQGLFVYPSEIKLKSLVRRPWRDAQHMVVDYLANSVDPLKASFWLHDAESTVSSCSEARRRWFKDRNRTVDPEVVEPFLSRPMRRKIHEETRIGNLSRAEGERCVNLPRYLSTMAELVRQPPTELRQLVQRDVHALFEALNLPSESPTAWAMKEVGGDPLAVFGLFKSWFPNGKIVVIIRDPRWIVRSILLDRRRRGVAMSPRDVLSQVVTTMRTTSRYPEVARSHGAHFVSYESLVGGNLEGEIRNICAYLKLNFSASFLRPSTLGQASVVRTASQSTAGVFKNSTRSWTEGLTISEVLLLQAAFAAYGVFSRSRDGFWPTYRHIIQSIDAFDRQSEFQNASKIAS